MGAFRRTGAFMGIKGESRIRRARAVVVGLALAAFVASACSSRTQSTSSGSITYDSWGGLNQQQETQALIGPFEKATGVNVAIRADADNMYSRIQAQVKAGRGDLDVVHLDASWLPEGAAAGMYAPIDYNVVPKDQLLPGVAQKYGVRYLYWSWNIVYNAKVFGSNAPKSWSQVWAYARQHPKRVALWESQPDYLIEIALMASGVPASQIYPLTPAKIDAAYQSLDRIKNDVLWFQGGTDGDKMFADGQVDAGMLYGGDTTVLQSQGAPLGLVWDQAVYTSDYLAVPVNAPHRDQAMKFIAWILQAQPQSAMAQLSGYGFVNTGSQRLITNTAALSELPSYGPNVAVELAFDDGWWGRNEAAQITRWNTWLRG